MDGPRVRFSVRFGTNDAIRYEKLTLVRDYVIIKYVLTRGKNKCCADASGGKRNRVWRGHRWRAACFYYSYRPTTLPYEFTLGKRRRITIAYPRQRRVSIQYNRLRKRFFFFFVWRTTNVSQARRRYGVHGFRLILPRTRSQHVQH